MALQSSNVAAPAENSSSSSSSSSALHIFLASTGVMDERMWPTATCNECSMQLQEEISWQKCEKKTMRTELTAGQGPSSPHQDLCDPSKLWGPCCCWMHCQWWTTLTTSSLATSIWHEYNTYLSWNSVLAQDTNNDWSNVHSCVMPLQRCESELILLQDPLVWLVNRAVDVVRSNWYVCIAVSAIRSPGVEGERYVPLDTLVTSLAVHSANKGVGRVVYLKRCFEFRFGLCGAC